MESIHRILDLYLNDLGIDRSVKQYRAVQLWPEVVGDKIASISKAMRFQKGKLFVTVENDSWRHELIYHKPAIIQKLNEKLGAAIVEDVIYT